MNRYKIELAYHGAAFHGWQIQPNGISVQEVIQEKISTLLQQKVEVVGCGRTDAGVHSRYFVAHFEAESIPYENFVYRLNEMLPKQIVIFHCSLCHPDFHARFSAEKREYEYHITNSKNPFISDLAWYVKHLPDLDSLNKYAQLLIGNREYRCFCKGTPPNGNYSCDISLAKWEKAEDTIVFRIQANRFLRNMVRSIVGTLIEATQGNMDFKDFENLLNSGSRSDAGQSVPAHGLFLTRVWYPDKV